MQTEQTQKIMGYFIEEAKDHLNIIEQGLLTSDRRSAWATTRDSLTVMPDSCDLYHSTITGFHPDAPDPESVGLPARLLNWQVTIEYPELLSELFRVAHSVKVGAAMLGINSVRYIAHRLEDSFKILQEILVKVDDTAYFISVRYTCGGQDARTTNTLSLIFIPHISGICCKLESLFWRVFDTLQDLLVQLSSFGLTEKEEKTKLETFETSLRIDARQSRARNSNR